MTQEEEKQLRLKDLCSRLPNKNKIKGVLSYDKKKEIFTIEGYEIEKEILYLSNSEGCYIDDFKYYLLPMSSMTEEERGEFRKVGGVMSYSPQHDTWAISAFAPEAYDWLNKNKFDYRGLIPMGLALEAPKDMYVF